MQTPISSPNTTAVGLGARRLKNRVQNGHRVDGAYTQQHSAPLPGAQASHGHLPPGRPFSRSTRISASRHLPKKPLRPGPCQQSIELHEATSPNHLPPHETRHPSQGSNVGLEMRLNVLQLSALKSYQDGLEE